MRTTNNEQRTPTAGLRGTSAARTNGRWRAASPSLTTRPAGNFCSTHLAHRAYLPLREQRPERPSERTRPPPPRPDCRRPPLPRLLADTRARPRSLTEMPRSSSQRTAISPTATRPHPRRRVAPTRRERRLAVAIDVRRAERGEAQRDTRPTARARARPRGARATPAPRARRPPR